MFVYIYKIRLQNSEEENGPLMVSDGRVPDTLHSPPDQGRKFM